MASVARGPVVVVLAAGRGARFGGAPGAAGHKLGQSFGGTTVLGRCLAQVLRSGLPRLVVTTPALHALAASVVGERDVLLLSDAGTQGEAAFGMGHSIAAGVSARPGAAGWLLLPGDMPLLRAATLNAVAAALSEHAIVHAQYHGRRGHPVGFRAELQAELTALGGDEGARRLLAYHAVHAVEVDDPGVLLDVDTLDDLHALRKLHAEGEGAADGG